MNATPENYATAEEIVEKLKTMEHAGEAVVYLKRQGFKLTYGSAEGADLLWEHPRVTTYNNNLKQEQILASMFFSFYRMDLESHERLTFITGRIGNTTTYQRTTKKEE